MPLVQRMANPLREWTVRAVSQAADATSSALQQPVQWVRAAGEASCCSTVDAWNKHPLRTVSFDAASSHLPRAGLLIPELSPDGWLSNASATEQTRKRSFGDTHLTLGLKQASEQLVSTSDGARLSRVAEGTPVRQVGDGTPVAKGGIADKSRAPATRGSDKHGTSARRASASALGFVSSVSAAGDDAEAVPPQNTPATQCSAAQGGPTSLAQVPAGSPAVAARHVAVDSVLRFGLPARQSFQEAAAVVPLVPVMTPLGVQRCLGSQVVPVLIPQRASFPQVVF